MYSFGEHSKTGLVEENYSRVTFVCLIFMSCRIKQDKVANTKFTQEKKMTE